MGPIPGALEAVARLNHAGWHVVVATNQAGIGRGMIDMASVNAVHAHMNQQLMAQGGRVDAVFFCPHTPEDHCECRKPRPGLMLDIGRRYGLDLAQVPMVGDTLRDLQAAPASRLPSRTWCCRAAPRSSARSKCKSCWPRRPAPRCTSAWRHLPTTCSRAATWPIR
jgi:histidinol-phosphate phosphatase family protein